MIHANAFHFMRIKILKEYSSTIEFDSGKLIKATYVICLRKRVWFCCSGHCTIDWLHVKKVPGLQFPLHFKKFIKL